MNKGSKFAAETSWKPGGRERGEREKDGQEKAGTTWRKPMEPTSLIFRKGPEPALSPQPRDSRVLPYTMLGMEVFLLLLCLYLARDVSYNFHKD